MAGVDLVPQIGPGNVGHRPVAPPHLVREIGPAPRHQRVAGEPQPARPGAAVASVPFAPDPGQLPERRVAVHQVRAHRGDALRQALHEQYLRRAHQFAVTHDGPLCRRHPVRAHPIMARRLPGMPPGCGAGDDYEDMESRPQFRTDLYKGTAPYYDRYRVPTPPQ